jgi:hypothetical protein
LLLLASGDQVFYDPTDTTPASGRQVKRFALDFQREVEGDFLGAVLPDGPPSFERLGRFFSPIFSPNLSYGVNS